MENDIYFDIGRRTRNRKEACDLTTAIFFLPKKITPKHGENRLNDRLKFRRKIELLNGKKNHFIIII